MKKTWYETQTFVFNVLQTVYKYIVFSDFTDQYTSRNMNGKLSM